MAAISAKLHSGHSKKGSVQPKLLAEGVVYKETNIGDFVLCRSIRLFDTKFSTFRDLQQPDDHTSWYLNPQCKLHPASKVDITAKSCTLRPPGTWSITALATGGEELRLYTFVVEWPALRGRHLHHNPSPFQFAFKSLEDAQRWHGLVEGAVAALAAASGEQGDEAPELRPGGLDAKEEPAGSPTQEQKMPSSATMPRIRSEAGLPPGGARVSSATAHMDGAEMAALWDQQLGKTSLSTRRWVPVRHTNGVAIYHHADGKDPYLGEFMVSTVVRGNPVECLSVLMNPSSNTTILGPASEVEVLASVHGQQTLRIRIEAPALASRIVRPREAVVQRLLKKESEGVYVILFSSVEQPVEPVQSGAEVVLQDAPPRYATSKGCVRMKVEGGYTISALEGDRSDTSCESLITCVLKVDDLGSWLSRGPMFYSLAYAGLADILIERMLMAVILVKDEVEHQRFAIKPFSMMQDGPPNVRQRSNLALLKPSVAGVALGFTTRRPGISRMATTKLRRAALETMLSGDDTLDGNVSRRIVQLKDSLPEEDDASSADLAAAVDARGTLDPSFYEELHRAGQPAPFKVRGATYLTDHIKVTPDEPVFALTAVDLVITAEPTEHISRYLKSVRQNSFAYNFVLNLIVPGPPTISLVLTWSTESHPDQLGPPPEDLDEGDWDAFDYCMWRFLQGDDEERDNMIKLIPHIEEGSWIVKQSVGTTPVILGTKLTTSYHLTQKYSEVSVDISSSQAAAYITGVVRGATKRLIIDLAVLFEGQSEHELPESLIGALRIKHLDMDKAVPLDTTTELPVRHVPSAHGHKHKASFVGSNSGGSTITSVILE